MATDEDFDIVEEIEEMPYHQITFDELLDKHNQGSEPLECWTTEDLTRLLDAVDRELQARNQETDEESADDDYASYLEYERELARELGNDEEEM